MAKQLSLTAAELEHLLGGALHGDRAKVIHRVATLEEAGPGALAWVGSPEFLSQLVKSKAGVVLVPEDCPLPADRTVICVADPDAAICEVLAYLAPAVDTIPRGVDSKATVSSEAIVKEACIGAHVYVGPHAEIGPGTQLHPGVYVGNHTRIGRDCVLWPNVVVRERVTIGDGVVIHPNATIGADGFGYLQREGKHRKIPQIGTVVIEDHVEIGANSAIDRARNGETRVGRGTKIDNLVQIGHNVAIGQDCIIIAQVGIAGSASLGDNVVLAGQVGIGDHRHLGNGSQIATKSVVLRNVPDGHVLRGVPAVENRLFLRRQASLRKLPELVQRLRELERRVQRLDADAGERTP